MFEKKKFQKLSAVSTLLEKLLKIISDYNGQIEVINKNMNCQSELMGFSFVSEGYIHIWCFN